MDNLLTERARAVDDRVTAILAKTSGAIVPAGVAASEITDQISASSTGGKRLRAQLIAASHDAHRGNQLEAAIGVGAAVELFQTAALLHDDVLDDSDTRRGRPAAHRVLADLHRRQDWLGSADDFGAAAGILAGDLTLMAAHRALFDAVQPLSSRESVAATALFADMAELVTVGQYLDMRVAAQPLATLGDQESAIRDVMRAKTASYSAEFPLALGAACAGASAESITAIRAIGVPLGIAFQLRDDVLGLTGSPAVTGKPAGDDIREGKRTMLVWRAWQVTDASGRARLKATLGRRDASDEEVAQTVAIIAATDAVDLVEQEIASLASNAATQLAALELDPRGVELLTRLFNAATDRAA
ncbi:polyprenyl synthetase family protein [Demequina oxidasica]|uniref:polyprenyl synthetase family protein n=1 Tax=Demequina oxidasica TaxID=676199 RepID=UPI0007861ECF|nr:polyprenyl synthetase family protein [Demequina oxidasica]